MAKKPDPSATPPDVRRGGRTALAGRRRLPLVLATVGLVVIIAVVWISVSAISVKDSLGRAQVLAGQMRHDVAAGDLRAAAALVPDLTTSTTQAAHETTQPIWRIFEAVPIVGPNLTAVRQLSAVLNGLATHAVQPLAHAAPDGFDSLAPVGGRIDLARVKAVASAVDDANGSLTASRKELADINTDATLRQIRTAKDQLSDLLASVQPEVSSIRSFATIAPALLGADGPRNYIVLFPNNAESVSLGGNTAAWLVVNVTDGLIAVTAQPSSADFDRSLGPPIVVPPELSQIYYPDLFGFEYVTNTELRPDFPTAGVLAQAFWARNTHQIVDGVLSFDPIALSYLLRATGPLTLPGGQVLAEDTAVKLLLSDVYSLFTEPAQQDAFFAEAADAVFTRLTTSPPNITALAEALGRAVDDNRLMAWSSHPEEQAVIASTRIAGTLEPDNARATQLGVFFVEDSTSKMSYYLQTAVSLTNTACQTPQAPTFVASIDTHSAIRTVDYYALPNYVKQHAYSEPAKTRTLVYVYGPVGATYVSTVWNGGGQGTIVRATGTDLGRPVVVVAVDLRPEESSNVTVTFAGQPGKYGPVSARVTPMVQPTAVTLANPECPH